MAITPQAGYEVDPNNPNGVRKIGSGPMPGSVAAIQQSNSQPSITYGAINSTNTQAQPVINLTPKPDNTNYQGMINGATAQAMSYQQPAATTPEKPKETPATSIQDYIASLSQIKQPSATDTYSSLYDQSGLAGQKEDLAAKAKVTAEAQSRLNNISAQLQALNTEATAVPIALQQDSIGRGRTESGVAPLQADELRKIALRALPLQAQGAIVQAEVANAQGQQQLAQDLYQQAEQHLDKVFQLQMTDLSNKYEFQTNLIDKVYAFADKQEQRQLASLKDQADKDYQTQRDTVAYQRQVEMDKIDYQRQVNLVNAKNQPVDDSKEVLSISEAKDLGVPYGTTKGDARNKGLVPGASPSGGTMQLSQAKGNIETINSLLTSGGLSGSVGTSPFSRLSPVSSLTGSKSDFLAGVQQITAQLSLDSLINAKAKGATFGALSEGELALLSASASKLNSWAVKDKNGNVTGYSTSEKNFKGELDKINNYAIQDYLLKGGNPTDAGLVQLEDGSYARKNSDGTYQTFP